MNFPTRYRSQVRFETCCGDPVKVLYAPVFDEKGVMHLAESGREDLYGYIQSHRDSVDLHKILERFAQGDAGVLERFQQKGVFGDFSEFPKTYAELLNTVISGEQIFNQLPLEVREKFGHSFNRWLAQAGSAEWLAAMGYETQADVVKPDPDPGPSPNSNGGGAQE